MVLPSPFTAMVLMTLAEWQRDQEQREQREAEERQRAATAARVAADEALAEWKRKVHSLVERSV